MMSIGVLDVCLLSLQTNGVIETEISVFASKVVTASPGGNFLLFDVSRGKLGMSSNRKGG